MNTHEAAINTLNVEIMNARQRMDARTKSLGRLAESAKSEERANEGDQAFIDQCRKSIRVLQEAKDEARGDSRGPEDTNQPVQAEHRETALLCRRRQGSQKGRGRHNRA